ncbi:phage holin family protein [Streptomyces purpureus]|uniref:Uncharacterized protein n=1 Tax=Streptomyces purpureus TaxID=1951 RepID=A0A918LXL6_9ACTN|nr:phage holin family protein [Streptomyces purpureus]GGT65002.1 hypothetical protein GCM10014713_67500 [Streptomyces purpureus]
MSSGHKTMTAFLALIAGLVLAIIGLYAQWPLWAWPAALGGLVAVAAGALITANRRRPVVPPERRAEPDLPIPPVERWEQVVRHVALPSLLDDYDFLVSATVRWLPVDAPANAPLVSTGGLAVDSVLERARRITVQQPPHRSTLVQHQLNGELATMVTDASGRVMAMAENVSVTLSDPDRERLEKLATVRKDEAVWEHERKWEQSKRAYLGDDVLKTTGSAVVWWLAKNNEQIDKTVSDIGVLARLSSAARDEPVPDEHVHQPPVSHQPYEEHPRASTTEEGATASVTQQLDLLMQSAGLAADDPRRVLFARRMAEVAKLADLPEVAEEIEDALARRAADPLGLGDDDPAGAGPRPFE